MFKIECAVSNEPFFIRFLEITFQELSLITNSSSSSLNKLFNAADSILLIDEIETGEAEIITTVENGIMERYSVIIEKIDTKSTENKNLIIKVTDRRLIEKTGGIIQGMSGSPIIQNGKIIGAVTHVFLNDATGGFGIFAETMLNKLENVK